MLNKQKESKTMNDINETMDQAVINDDFNKIESIALNPKNALVRVHEFNMFTGQGRFVKKWVDISSVINQEDYFDDLSSDCQSYVMQLDKYKDLDYDKIVDDFDKPIEIKNNKWLEDFKKQINKKK